MKQSLDELDPNTPRRRMRWGIPFAILLLAVAAVTWIQFGEVIFKPHITALVIILVSLLLALWYIFFTGLGWRWRMAYLVVLLAGVLGAGLVVKNFTRMEGSYTGEGFPKLAWKWTPKPDEHLSSGVMIVTHSTQLQKTNVVWDTVEFPEYLGRGRSNVVRGWHLEHDWKVKPPQELWRRPVGLGWSSFAMAGGRAVTQEQRGAHELIVCYGLLDGEILWAHTNKVRFEEKMGGDGPRATPTLAGGRVYALGATGILDCLDADTGRLIWSRDTLTEARAQNLEWGKSSSPLVFDDHVVVSGGKTGPLLLAFHRETGAPLWQGGNGRSSYASPTLATLLGQRQILSVNGGSVTGHDSKSGRVLWEYSWPGEFPKSAQPVAVAEDKVFISAAYGLGSVLLKLTAGAEDRISTTEEWRGMSMKAKFASVVVREGFVYGLDDGILACIELETGKRRWKGGRYGHGQVLLVEDTLLVQTEPGDIVLVQATPEEDRELARVPALKGKTWNTPALAGEYLLVRNDREAVCFRLPMRREATR